MSGSHPQQGGKVVEMEQFEHVWQAKENIVPIKQGRKADVLARKFGGETLDENAKMDSETTNTFEAEIAAAQDEGEDPLDPYFRYIRWIQQHSTVGSSLPLMRVVEQAARRFRDDPRYKNDPRYLKVWLITAKQADDPSELFKYLSKKEIGSSLAMYYEEYATFLETRGRFDECEQVFNTGVKRKAQPLKRMEDKRSEFLRRQSRRMEALEEEGMTRIAARRNQPVHPSFASSSSALSSSDRHGCLARSQNPTLSKSTSFCPSSSSMFKSAGEINKESLKVFQDAETPLPVPLPSSSEELASYEFEAFKSKENNPEASAWKGSTLPQGKAKAQLEKPLVNVYRDIDDTENIKHEDSIEADSEKFGTSRNHEPVDETLQRSSLVSSLTSPSIAEMSQKSKGKLMASEMFLEEPELSFEEARVEKMRALGQFNVSAPSQAEPPRQSSFKTNEEFSGQNSIDSDNPLSSPIPPEASNMRHIASPTVNTKAALQDVFEMFSQPLNSQAMNDEWEDETISALVIQRKLGGKVDVFQEVTETIDVPASISRSRLRHTIVAEHKPTMQSDDKENNICFSSPIPKEGPSSVEGTPGFFLNNPRYFPVESTPFCPTGMPFSSSSSLDEASSSASILGSSEMMNRSGSVSDSSFQLDLSHPADPTLYTSRAKSMSRPEICAMTPILERNDSSYMAMPTPAITTSGSTDMATRLKEALAEEEEDEHDAPSGTVQIKQLYSENAEADLIVPAHYGNIESVDNIVDQNDSPVVKDTTLVEEEMTQHSIADLSTVTVSTTHRLFPLPCADLLSKLEASSCFEFSLLEETFISLGPLQCPRSFLIESQQQDGDEVQYALYWISSSKEYVQTMRVKEVVAVEWDDTVPTPLCCFTSDTESWLLMKHDALAGVSLVHAFELLALPNLEVLLLFWTAELIGFVKALHANGVAHTRLAEPESVVCRLEEKEDEMPWDAVYSPTKSGGWDSKGVMVMRWECAVFSADHQSSSSSAKSPFMAAQSKDWMGVLSCIQFLLARIVQRGGLPEHGALWESVQETMSTWGVTPPAAGTGENDDMDIHSSALDSSLDEMYRVLQASHIKGVLRRLQVRILEGPAPTMDGTAS